MKKSGAFLGAISLDMEAYTNKVLGGQPYRIITDGLGTPPYITAATENGAFAAFGGLPVTSSEAVSWLASFLLKGYSFLSDIPKPVWSFVWDPTRREAVVAVDRYRINSLYWQNSNGALYFSSTLSEILFATDTEFQIDPNALFSYLDLLCVPADLSIQKGVSKLGGGECLVVSEKGINKIRYHQFVYRDKLSGGESQLADLIYDRVVEGVKESLSWAHNQRAGCFLSGGTDSSSILGCCAQISGPGFPAYSVSFSENYWDELEYASLAAKSFGAEHHIVKFEMNDVWRITETLATSFDEPIGNPSLMATYLCVERASNDGVTCMLAGDGGDELFGGNERYATDSIYSRYYATVPALLRKVAKAGSALAVKLSDTEKVHRLHRILLRADRPNPERYYFEDAFAQKIFPTAFCPDYVSNIDSNTAFNLFALHFASAEADYELDKLLYVDMRHTLGDNDLVKVGMSGIANGVDILYPFLSGQLVDTACRLPCWAKLKGMEKRYIFKKAMTRLVPEKILYKQKHGFGLPVAHWLRNDQFFQKKFSDVVFDPERLALHVLDQNFLHTLFKNHQRGVIDAGMFLWGLYYLNVWHEGIKSRITSSRCTLNLS